MGKSAPNFEKIVSGWQYRILNIAQSLGMNRADIARMVEREPAAISAWFKDKPPNITIGVLAKLCQEMKVSSDYILFDKGSATETKFKVLINNLLAELDKKEVIDQDFIKKIDKAVEQDSGLKPVLDFVTELHASKSNSPETIAKLLENNFDSETRKQLISQILKTM